MLQQHLPPAVCAEGCETAEEQSDDEVRTSQVPERSEGKTKVMKQQYLPLAVLKPVVIIVEIVFMICCNTTYRLRYEPQSVRQQRSKATMRSTHRLPERSEGKTKAISNSTYCLRYWNPFTINKLFMRYSCCNNTYRLRYWNTIVSTGISHIINSVAITPTVYGMRRRVRDGRGAKRRWGPHISSTWTKRR